MMENIIVALLGILVVYFAYRLGLAHGAIQGMEFREDSSPLLISAEQVDGGSILLHDYIDQSFIGQVKSADEINEFIAQVFPEQSVLVVGIKPLQ